MRPPPCTSSDCQECNGRGYTADGLCRDCRCWACDEVVPVVLEAATAVMAGRSRILCAPCAADFAGGSQ